MKLFSKGASRPSAGSKRSRDVASAAAAGKGGSGLEASATSGGVEDFSSLGLQKWLCDAVNAMSITKPTPVQRAVIPAMLAGRDVVACAKTGTGKTAAFALPLLQLLAAEPYGVFALVLTPARELAFQVAEQVRAFGAPINTRVSVIVGGMDLVTQAKDLQGRPHVVVATPGRLADHIRSGAQLPPLGRLGLLVLDEADRLLEPGFASDLGEIVSLLPPAERRQNVLVSATIQATQEQADAIGISDAFRFSDAGDDEKRGRLRETYLFVPDAVRTAYLHLLLLRIGPDRGDDRDVAADGGGAGATGARRRSAAATATTGLEALEGSAAAGMPKGKGKKAREASALAGDDVDGPDEAALAEAGIPRASSAIVFSSTIRETQLLRETLTELGYKATALHSKMSQRERLNSLGKFKAGVINILVATDVAARGLDIPHVGLVVNYTVPRVVEDYVHRIGRTARAGRDGHAVTIIGGRDVELVQAIEGTTGRKMQQLPGCSQEAMMLRLTRVANARRLAQVELVNSGFEEKLDEHAARVMRSRKAREDLIRQTVDQVRQRHGAKQAEEAEAPSEVAVPQQEKKRRRKGRKERLAAKQR